MTSTADADVPDVPRTVLVVGAGLIGTSLGLALTRHGVTVHLTDADPASLAAATARGAGRPGPPPAAADLGVVCVPPGATAAALAEGQAAGHARAWTDTASVKTGPLQEARRRGVDLAGVVGGHPMAGAERSGPAAARGDLFAGRPWVLTPVRDTDPDVLGAVRAVLDLVGAVPVSCTPEEHDAAVATVSHGPQVVATLLAGLLEEAGPLALGIAGQGLRDTVRVAASPSALWVDILRQNSGRVTETLDRLAADLARLRLALAGDPGPSGADLAEILERGRRGHARLPGKHGTAATYATVAVLVDDRPGHLARLFADVGAAGVNVEDVAIDHAPGQPQGLVQLSVRPEAAEVLVSALLGSGWSARPGP